MRILGIDPGLTRCGIGVVEADQTRQVKLVSVSVVRSSPKLATHFRLNEIAQGIDAQLRRHRPDIVAIERVFAQDNLQSVTTTMMVMGCAMARVGSANLPMAVHTPSEVKAAVTGSGTAPKKQVQAMIARILGLSEVPKPADAADALAVAICHAWRGTGVMGASFDEDFSVSLSGRVQAKRQLTPAQQAWAEAQAKLRRTGAVAPKK